MALDRFLWFIPIFWIIIIAIVLDYYTTIKPKTRRYGIILIVAQMVVIIANHKVFTNIEEPSFREYYSTELFNKARQEIGKEQSTYKIMNIGFEPAITQYNGFYTLDGFSGNYSLEYKHAFHKIIKKELYKKNGWSLRRTFELWGSKCYSFSQDFGRRFGKKHWKPINNLDYDWYQAKKMGAQFVFSPVEINTNNICDLELVKSYKNQGFYYPLNIYKIK